jgi:nicotinate-nucleotide adenylyltransferase
MTRLATADEPSFEVSLADAPKPSGAPNYTLETLLSLRGELSPRGALFCLMGADSFFGLRGWHRAAEIPFAAPLIVASRPGQQLEGLKAALPPGLTIEPAPEPVQAEADGAEAQSYLLRNSQGDVTAFYILPGLQIDISASQVRQVIRGRFRPSAGAAAELQLLPHGVLDYIRSHGLYR